MNTRLVKDFLHDEYYDILPKLRLINKNTEVEIKHALLPIYSELKPYERIEVSTRIKDVESVIEKLKGKQEGNRFDEKNQKKYRIKDLKDLIGIRIAFFPSNIKEKIWNIITELYPKFEKDVTVDFDDEKKVIIEKLYGSTDLEPNITIEIQFLSLFYSRFLDIEHDLIYKPDSRYKGVKKSLEMRKQKSEVLNKLKEFEGEFLKIILE